MTDATDDVTGASPAPRVSVVIPTYKRAAKLRPVVDSALAQTVRDIEVVVVDDASGDGTDEVVAAVGDPRVRLVVHERNLGGNAARLTGIRESVGRYVAFLDSDDTWLPTKLERQLDLLALRGPDYGLCATWYRVESPSGEVIATREHVVDGVAAPDLLVANWLGGYSSILVERRALERFGGPDPSLRACQDWDLFLRLNEHVGVCVVPEVLVVYVQDFEDPVRISTRRDSVSSGLRHAWAHVRRRWDELDDATREASLRNFMFSFANIGAAQDVARIAAQVPPRLWSPGLARHAAHMQARGVRKRLVSRRGRARN